MKYDSRVVVVLVLTVLTLAIPCQAQEIAVVHVRSLDAFFDGIEKIAGAAGQDVDREMLLQLAEGQLGVPVGAHLDMKKPVAIVLPVAGMMMQQNGIVAAIPVIDTAAALEALEGRFASHSVEAGLYTFSSDEVPVLFAMKREGYLILGGSGDLVSKIDPLAGETPQSALSMEFFLEPIAPMILSGLQMASHQMKTEIQKDLASEEAEIDPQAMAGVFDLYFDGIGTLIENTSSFRIALDVEDGFLRIAQTLVPKEGSTLAEFAAAQKGGFPKVARLVPQNAAFVVNGKLALTESLRQEFKVFADRYMDLTTQMFTKPAEAAPEGGDTKPAESPNLWVDYMESFAPYTGRWVECFNGDFSASFDFTSAGSISVIEAVGMERSKECRTLLQETTDHMRQELAENDELSEMLSVSDGPRFGRSRSYLMTVDNAKMVESMGQPNTDEATKMMETIYGEKMTVLSLSGKDYVAVALGAEVEEGMKNAMAGMKKGVSTPDLAPLEDGLSMSMLLDLGRCLSGFQAMIPEAPESVGELAKKLSGKAGRIPMGVRFEDGTATSQAVIPLLTIETIASFAAEQKAKEQPKIEGPE